MARPDDPTLTLLSVNLTEKTARDLYQLVATLDDENATDVTNRAIQLYLIMVDAVRGKLGTTFVMENIEHGSPRFLHCMVDVRR